MNSSCIKAVPIQLTWHTGLPVFASEAFLSAVSDQHGWLGGVDDSGALRCVLPYTVIRKSVFRMVRLRVETIPLADGFGDEEEKAFLNSAVQHLRSVGDVIIPGTTNAIFSTYPDGANAAPYGTYVIDLAPTEEELWKQVGRITRQNIGTARKSGVTIASEGQDLNLVYQLILETFRRSKLPFMGYESFERFVRGLGENKMILTAEHQGSLQSCVVFAFSHCCAYAVYAGNLEGQQQGANKLIYWEAIRLFRQLGARRFDFVGARIDPEKGSKAEAINMFKQRFGARLVRGFIWKYDLRPFGSLVYSLAVRFFRGGDIVDRERHKMGGLTNVPPCSPAICRAR